MWYLPNINDSNGWLWHLKRIQADLAWDITKGNPEIVIAVIDTWFDITHPNLENKFIKNYDSYDNTVFCENSSNNMMDNVSDNYALSPCQIEQINTHIESRKTTLYPCYYSTEVVNITNNIIENTSFIARDIIIPISSNVKVKSENVLYINAEEFEIKGAFEVELGGILEINTTPACN